MISIILTTISNLMIGLIGIPLYIRYAINKQIVDIPNHRSSHTVSTPRGGGIVLVLGTLALSSILSSKTPDSFAWPLIATSLGIAILGFVDDIKELPSLGRLGAQIALAAILFVSIAKSLHFSIFNVQLDSASPLIWLAGLGTVIWIVGCLNIFNFMDGIDGIASLQGLAASLAWAIICHSTGAAFLAAFSTTIGSGLIAFLFYNWAPAKVFMGDCASSFLGFAFAAIPLVYAATTGSETWLAINLGALILFPFLFDGAFTLSCRALNNENLFEAHKSHLYQRWTLRGKSHRYVSSMYGLWATASGGAALLVHFDYISLFQAYGIVLVPAAIIAFRVFKNAEPKFAARA